MWSGDGPDERGHGALDQQPAAALESVRGLGRRLTGAGVATPQGASAPQTFALWPRVIFRNKTYVADSLIY